MAQLNDLIVTGKSRFLNEINGQIDWSNVLSKPATYAPTIGTTSTTALAGDTKYAGASTAGGAATSAAKLTNTSKIGDTNKPVYFTASGVPSAISYTIDKSVPSTAVFTDANVTQTASDSSDNNYELLFSATADNTTRTEGARKSQALKYNPYYQSLKISTTNNNSTLSDTTLSINTTNTSDTRGSSLGSSMLHLQYATNSETRSITLGAYATEAYSPTMIVEQNYGGTNYCKIYYTYNDIILSSGGNMVTTWDGINTSLKDAVSKLANKTNGTWRTETTIAVGGTTYQIPSDVLTHPIILISMRRYGYGGTAIVHSALISEGAYASGVHISGTNNIWWDFTISATGKITLTTKSSSAGDPMTTSFGFC